MRMDKKSVHDLCKDVLDTCNSINMNFIILQNRVELELPVDETVKIIDAGAQAFNERIEALLKAIVEGDENVCEKSC